jgi:hypothetical protein
MNARYKPGDYEARHDDPAWRQRANFVIAANISEKPEKREWEQLWARQVGNNRFEICCIPFFVYDLALGDEVEVDENHVLRRVVQPSGHYTFRAWFGESRDPADRDRVVEVLRGKGCEYEWSSENLLAIDAATKGIAQEISNVLAEWQIEGRLTFETGRTA